MKTDKLNPWCARCELLGPNIGGCKWPDDGTNRPGCYAGPADAAGTCDPETGDIVATDRIGCHEGRADPPPAERANCQSPIANRQLSEPDPEAVRREGRPYFRPDSPEAVLARALGGRGD